MDVAGWLRGLSEYMAAFDNAVTMDLLPTLTADDLKDLGVTIIGHRRRLLNAVTALRADTEPVAAPSTAELIAERRQVSVYRHCGNVLELRVGSRGNGDAEFGEHVDDALDRKRRLACLVAGPVEADDQSVAHELVAANAGDGCQVLHSLGTRGGGAGQAEDDSQEERLQVFHACARQNRIDEKNRASSPGRFASFSAPLAP